MAYNSVTDPSPEHVTPAVLQGKRVLSYKHSRCQPFGTFQIDAFRRVSQTSVNITASDGFTNEEHLDPRHPADGGRPR